MKGHLIMRLLLCLFLVTYSLVQMNVAWSEEKLQLWPYIEQAALQDQKDRKLEGVSYLVGGVAATILPFITTSPGSPMRTIGVYTLIPAGIYSILYGGYIALTDSSWMKVKKQVESLSGPEDTSTQWALRRETYSRQVLLERADSTRFWRYLWGGIEASAGLLVIRASQSTESIITSGVLFGLSAYSLLHLQADERLVNQLDSISAGLTTDGGIFIAHRMRY